MPKFDVVVAGAGSAGCLTARTAAKAGLKVCLVDSKHKENIGTKICGDAVGRHHFDHLGLEKPKGVEVERVIEGIRIFSPDMQENYLVKSKRLYGYILNRKQFGQRLLKEAVDANVSLLDLTQVLEPVVEEGFVCGVLTKDVKQAKKRVIRAPIVVDATGFTAAIRKKLKGNGIESDVKNEDVEVCYREIRQLSHPVSEPSLCHIYLNQAMAPGGYYWIFAKGNMSVNVGLGVAMTRGFPNPKTQFYRYVASRPEFRNSTVVDKGTWYVSTRRPLNSMVDNGVIIVGDAACQANPIHGGGIGPSMIGGTLAGETVVNALEKDDVSREGLWAYNVNYMRDYGAKQAGLEVFRILVQCIKDDDLNFGMKYKLLTEEDLLKTSRGEHVHFTINEKAKRVYRGLRRLSFLRKLRRTAKCMRAVQAAYKNYPTSPKDLEMWKSQVDRTFDKFLSKLKE